jgi:hypothetical protein
LELPTFPQFHQLVHPRTFEVASGVAATRKGPQGLFDGLLGGDVTVLHQDATENPGKYDDQTVGLLTQLVQGHKKRADLEEAERGLLDLATITFSSYVPPKKAPKLEPQPAPQMQKFAEEDNEESMSETADVPEIDTPTYWWL